MSHTIKNDFAENAAHMLKIAGSVVLGLGALYLVVDYPKELMVSLFSGTFVGLGGAVAGIVLSGPEPGDINLPKWGAIAGFTIGSLAGGWNYHQDKVQHEDMFGNPEKSSFQQNIVASVCKPVGSTIPYSLQPR